MIDEKRNLFFRLLFAVVVGITAAKLSHFVRPLMIPAPAFVITLGMSKFSMKSFLEKTGALFLGLSAGLIITESLIPNQYLELILIFTIFVTVLKLFSHNYKKMTVFLTLFSFLFSTIFGSYETSNFETEILQGFWEFVWVLVIVRIAFILFPSNLPEQKEKPPIEKGEIPNWQICFFSLILTLIWVFYMMFEWRFAFAAYVVLISVFMDFDLERMNEKALQNLKGKTLACILPALFSLLLYGIISNVFLMILGITLLYFPLLYKLVYSEDPKESSLYFGICSSMMTPLTLYVNLSGAAVYQSFMRSLVVGSLMVFLIFIIGLLPKAN